MGLPIKSGYTSITGVNERLQCLVDRAYGTGSDAFGRTRVSEPKTLFDSNFIFNDGATLYDEITVGSGATARDANESAIDMTVTAAAGDRAVRQSRRYLPYQPGKSLLVLCTGTLETSGGVSGIRSRFGYFDDLSDGGTGNGFFVQLDGTDVSIVKRSSVTGAEVDTVVAQADWNGDKMDGSGASGHTLDPSKSQIFWLDVEWLGVGSVRCGFVVDGAFILCHTFHHANTGSDTTYMKQATLPVRYEIENVSAASGGAMKQICASVVSEGGFNPRGTVFSAGNGITGVVSSTTETFLCALRLASGSIRCTLNPLKISTVNTANNTNPYIIRVYIAQAPASSHGASWAAVGSGSGAEFTTTAGAAIPSITPVSEVYLSGDASALVTQFQNEILGNADIAGTADEIIITGQAFSGSETLHASIQWQEWG